MEPRIWLGLAVGTLLASVVPYWFWIGPVGLVVCAVLALLAIATLWLNVRGERRLTREAAAEEERQRLTDEGAPTSTSAAGTSTEPSSRW